MTVNSTCPASLLRRKAEIAEFDPNSQTIAYNSAGWEKWVGEFSEFSALKSRLPESVSRRDLTRLGAEVVGDRGRIRELFLAAMVFGYGNNGRKYRVRAMLNALDESPTLLHDTMELLLAGKVAEAHNAFVVPQCRQPFFTKFFYVVGLGANLAPLPLILDSRVYLALSVIHDRGEIDQWQYYTRSSWTADGYARYVEDMNAWASQLGCRPDAVEMYLFHHAASLL